MYCKKWQARAEARAPWHTGSVRRRPPSGKHRSPPLYARYVTSRGCIFIVAISTRRIFDLLSVQGRVCLRCSLRSCCVLVCDCRIMALSDVAMVLDRKRNRFYSFTIIWIVISYSITRCWQGCLLTCNVRNVIWERTKINKKYLTRYIIK